MNLEIWPKWKILLKQFVNATPLKHFHRISWNFAVVKDIPCRCTYPHDILIQFFFRNFALWKLEIWPKLKILLKTVRQSVSTSVLFFLSAQLLWISWNSVVMKDLMCRGAYPQEILIHFFWDEALLEHRNLTKSKDTLIHFQCYYVIR